MAFKIKAGFNKSLMIDTAIATFIVNTSPALLRKLVPQLSTSTTGKLSAGAVTYLIGMLMKKPNVSNIGLAIALAETISDVAVNPLMSTIMPGSTAPALQGYTRLIPNNTPLRDYSRVAVPSKFSQYKNYY